MDLVGFKCVLIVLQIHGLMNENIKFRRSGDQTCYVWPKVRSPAAGRQPDFVIFAKVKIVGGGSSPNVGSLGVIMEIVGRRLI